MYGLYDTQGMLRFVCTDKDACIAYAELFDISTPCYSLMLLEEGSKSSEFNDFMNLPNPAKSSN